MRPIVNLISLPLIVLTLGLMLLVVNALMLMLTSAISGGLNLGFHVDGFWTALFGSIVISLASMVLESIFPHAALSRDDPSRAHGFAVPDRVRVPRQHLPVADGLR